MPLLSIDPLDPQVFQELAIAAGFWTAAYADVDDLGRARLLGRHHWKLLSLTSTGRSRLRQWAPPRKPIVVEPFDARNSRIRTTLQYHGDLELLDVASHTIASLPAPVIAYTVSACLFVVTGRSSYGWTTSSPLPRRLPIVLAGHRTDEEIAQTVRHEIAHRWTLAEDLAREARPDLEIVVATATVADVMRGGGASAADVTRAAEAPTVRNERTANALAIGWREHAFMTRR